MRLLTIFAAGTLAIGLMTSASAQEAKQAEPRNLCTHATSRAGYGCPSSGPSVGSRIARVEAWQDARDLRDEINAALLDGRCEDARKLAVNNGRHELAARIRKACAATS